MENPEYEKVRDDFRARVMAIKDARRVAVGPYLNFLFENRDTMHYQIQEMMRVERITEEEAIAHEIKTYNGLIPGAGELSATLLIEIDNPNVRDFKLRELVGLDEQVFLLIDRDYQIQAKFDDMQFNTEKMSSVQYIRFELGEQGAEALKNTDSVEFLTTHPACSYRMSLSARQIAALKEDLQA